MTAGHQCHNVGKKGDHMCENIEYPKWYGRIGEKYNLLMSRRSELMNLEGKWDEDEDYRSLSKQMRMLRPKRLTLEEFTSFERWVQETFSWADDPRPNSIGKVPKHLADKIRIRAEAYSAAIAFERTRFDPSLHFSVPFFQRVNRNLQRATK